MNVNSENFITIQGWMRTELNLKGNDLLVYAIIYGFSQTNNQKFTGSLQYLADWCGATKQGILKNLSNLIKAGLIIKVEELQRTYYYTTKFTPYTTKFTPEIKLSLPNNISNNIDNKKESISKDIEYTDNKPSFEFGKTNQPKQSLYSFCMASIYNFTNNQTIQKELKAFVDSLSEMKKLKGQKQFTSILNKLNEYGKTDDEKIRIIRYSIEHGYGTFYKLEDRKNKKVSSAKSDVVRATKEQKEAIRSGKGTQY